MRRSRRHRRRKKSLFPKTQAQHGENTDGFASIPLRRKSQVVMKVVIF